MFETRPLYTIYPVTIRMRGKLCGGVPRNPDLIRSWVVAGTGHDDAKTDEQVADAEASIDAVVEKSWNGFPRDPEMGLFIECRQVKAMLKQSASLLRITVTKSGSKQILAEGMEVKAPDGGDRLYLLKEEPDGYDEQPIHVKTPQGPRDALKRVDYVEGVDLDFEIWVLKTAPLEKRHIGKKELEQILTHGQENGLGADRSQGRGKFDVIRFGDWKAEKQTEAA